ncbi:MAG: phospholipase A [Bacteroidetes bacterium]|jgi:outer membrane phospholipase A|nr:phospholipase A [Bacteroidota bacterium]
MMPIPPKSMALSPKILIALLSVAMSFRTIPCLAQSKSDSLKKQVKVIDPDTIKDVPNRLTEYEPNYIISNFTQNYFGQVKFQLSLKFDLNIRSEKNKLYFALTELVFWDLYRRSAPMKELDFKPILFYQHKLNKLYAVDDKWLFKISDYRIGFQHESNGQDGSSNRSLYKIIGGMDLAFLRKEPEQLKFTLSKVTFSARAWAWTMVDPENSNIADYTGYGQLTTALQFDYGVKSRFRPYQLEVYDIFTPARAGMTNEVNVTFNPFIGHLDFDWIPYLHLQFFHGYGEGLLYYNNSNTNYKPINLFRVGVQFRVF